MPYFSIIVPVYNVAPYLRKALDSVVAQTFTDWECLCVDDGSTDGSGAILDEYAAKDKRFRVFHKENKGVSAARNLGLDHAGGEWICFLDGDDALYPQLLATCIECVRAHDDCDLVSYKHARCENISFVDATREGCASNSVDLTQKIPFCVVSGGLWERIYRRARMGHLRFQPFARAEDRLYSGEAICRARKIIMIDFTGYFYRARIGSAMLTPETVKKIQESAEVSFELIKLFSSYHERVDPRIIRAKCVMFSEMTACRLKTLSNSDEKKTFIAQWRKQMLYLTHEQHISLWFRFCFFIVGHVSFNWIWQFLFYLPFWLKLKRNGVLKFLRKRV